jgi:hypothetical protein
MNSNANAAFTPVVLNHPNEGDYEWQHSQQNATVDFKPPIEIEELYVQQFRKMLNYFATETVPVGESNRFNVTVVLPAVQREFEHAPPYSLLRPSVSSCTSSPYRFKSGTASQLHAAFRMLRSMSHTNDRSSKLQRYVLFNQKQGAHTEYLRSSSARRLRFVEKSVPLDFSETFQLLRTRLRAFASHCRQYLLRTSSVTEL